MFIDKTFKYLSFIASVCLIQPLVCCKEYTIKSYSKSNVLPDHIIKEVNQLLNKEETNLIFNYGCNLSLKTFSCFNNLFVSTDDKDHVVGCCFVVVLPSFLNIEAFAVEDYNLIDKVGNDLICRVEDFAKDSKMLGIVLQPTPVLTDFFRSLGYVNTQIITLRMIKYLK